MTGRDQLDLDAYLDDLMDERQRAAFEQRLRSDEQLRRLVDCQRRIDASLASRFAPPAHAPPASVRLRHPAMAARREPAADSVITPAWRRRMAAAAALLAVGLGAWSAIAIMRWTNPSPHIVGSHSINPDHPAFGDWLDRKIATGFEPAVPWSSDQQFASMVRQRFGQPLRLRAVPAGITILGWDFVEAISPQTVALLLRADGREIVVLIDRLACDGSPSLVLSCGFQAFHQERGALRLYEISQLPESRLLRYFENPDAAAAPPT